MTASRFNPVQWRPVPVEITTAPSGNAAISLTRLMSCVASSSVHLWVTRATTTPDQLWRSIASGTIQDVGRSTITRIMGCTITNRLPDALKSGPYEKTKLISFTTVDCYTRMSTWPFIIRRAWRLTGRLTIYFDAPLVLPHSYWAVHDILRIVYHLTFAKMK